MKWKTASSMAWTNMVQTPLRVALTVLGVVVGTACLVSMAAFGVGLQKIGAEQVSKTNFLNTITVFPAPARHRNLAGPQARRPSPSLDDAALAQIASLPGVSSVTPVVQFPAQVKTARGEVVVLGRSVSPGSTEEARVFQLSGGRWPSPGGKREVVLHQDILPLFDIQNVGAALGRSVRLAFVFPQTAQGPAAGIPLPGVGRREEAFKVVGVLKKQEDAFANPVLRTELLLPLDTVKDLGLHGLAAMESMFRNPGSASLYTMAQVVVGDVSRADSVHEAVAKMGFNSVSLGSIMKEMNRFFVVFDCVLGAVGSIALLVAGLGIANTMIVAILERRKEIGIMKSVGARRRDIKQVFFMEAVLVGGAGGVLGVGLGWCVSRAVNAVVNVFMKESGAPPAAFFSFPLWLVGLCVAFAVAVALASALYPASRAAKLDPVEALRYE